MNTHRRMEEWLVNGEFKKKKSKEAVVNIIEAFPSNFSACDWKKYHKNQRNRWTDPELKLVQSTVLPLPQTASFEKLWTVQRWGIYIACTWKN